MVDFGFQAVPASEKEKLVNEVFNDVADKYDLMNDLSSFGLHRLWKKQAVKLMNLSLGDVVLDVASGTGDMAYSISKKIGTSGSIIVSDINNKMLLNGRDRLLDKGVDSFAINCSAESLPFKDSTFDKVSIAFGLRNITKKAVALKEMNRVLKPSGKLVILEFSKIIKSVAPIYDWYSFNVMPLVGERVAGTRNAYKYLAESIRQYPTPEEVSNLILGAGFLSARFQTMSFGVVSIHQAISG
ncbi:MAG: bifunctional demethylmenaquinone methyltransferase/2-methoxy-6-polyprenyl-1,4-benzoquinol methylase [Betaproteobacteria bacterium TMED41]|nr:MAG: bifunctional demethylmenaquinone methyltransferase/2-methoxy-6-polyprenyl-1,4-benzoquinol methylase [Betaproteobacteria bacterium TMED41]